jgi:chaperone required for assembly of F1-ATPase
MLKEITDFGDTDLLCYRAPKDCLPRRGRVGAGAEYDETSPGQVLLPTSPRWGEGLRARQDALFDPVLDSINQAYGMEFHITEGLVPIPQPQASLTRLKALCEAADDRELAALFVLTPLLGSVLLALSLWKRLISFEKALACSRVDEAFQAEQWGQDAQEKARWETKQRDIEACVVFLDLQANEK